MNNNYIHDCNSCTTKCDGRSKGVYNFLSDVDFSEKYEQELISNLINSGYYACKTEKDGYPDVEVYDASRKTLLCYIEVKAQRRTFMSVKRILPDSNLYPSETLALNLSDLKRYFQIKQQVSVPVYIMWALSNRPCVVNGVGYFYQNVDVLEKIYQHCGDTRTFRRESGYGDVVNGKHLGVVVNYHFSLNEFEPFSINAIL